MTEKTQPTDTELDALIAEYRKRIYPQDMQPRFKRAIMRAAIAKWGPAPAVEEEQVGWMWQHDETGRTGFVNCGQVENGWQKINPRLRLVSRLYTTPQPTQPQAGPAPLTKEQRIRIVLTAHTVSEAIDMVERHYGIKGDQHDKN